MHYLDYLSCVFLLHSSQRCKHATLAGGHSLEWYTGVFNVRVRVCRSVSLVTLSDMTETRPSFVFQCVLNWCVGEGYTYECVYVAMEPPHYYRLLQTDSGLIHSPLACKCAYSRYVLN